MLALREVIPPRVQRLAQALAQRKNVSAIPTLAIYVRGKEIARQAGLMPQSDLVAWVKRQTDIARAG